MNFNRLTEIAYALKTKNIQTGRAFHVTFILNKSKISSIGINNYFKTHPRIKEFNYSPHKKVHSELRAALNLGLSDCSGLTLVNVRINNNNQLDNSAPCRGCTDLLSQLSFKNVYHTNGHGQFQKFNF